ncbi:MAG TPA: tRNA (adenosine(37)-N6)-dimethylallyltransferase MiaA [Candidatus Acidoferrales bacterium]|nr:tRNA (adenosine(37)-N6)-dimethylallyltransferase MiaA [Candidatus Acidoferrales bacterium]
MKPRIVVIVGPTGVRKSDLALEIALQAAGEIVNADSQQVYRHMDIGTGKPSPEARRAVPHHLIDVVDPDDEFNAALFREAALAAVRQIRARNKNVIVCGGTGLYLRALLGGLFAGPAKDEALRSRLEGEAARSGIGELYRRLKAVDPELARALHPNDRQRIIRALEVVTLTGKKMSAWQKEHGFKESWCEALKIGLDRERRELYERINRRCEAMFSRGLIDEVGRLMQRGYGLELKPMQSIGYRHAGLYLRGELSLDEALELMKRDTRHLAKRQLTWFRAERDIRWFHPERDAGEILKSVKAFLQ